MVEVLFAYEADANIRNRGRTTPLMTAIEKNNTKMVELLLKNGAKPNFTSDDVAPLDKALELGNQEIIKLPKRALADMPREYE